jgi:hypothetical protein
MIFNLKFYTAKSVSVAFKRTELIRAWPKVEYAYDVFGHQ